MAACAGCSADLTGGELYCPYCGTAVKGAAAAAPEATGDLRAKSGDGGELGFGRDVRTFSCNTCGATVSWDPAKLASTCTYCGSHAVIEAPEGDESRPARVVPFALDSSAAEQRFRSWLGKGWFRPRDLQTSSLVGEMRGVYLPFWAFDADAESDWTASAGYNYQEPETYTATENGRPVTRTRTVTKTRWQPARGAHRERYDDWMIAATKGVDAPLLAKVFPYRTNEARPYDAAYLAGFGAERPAMRAGDVRQNAANALYQKEIEACGKMVPGDTHRDLAVSTRFSNWAYDLVLLPLWISSYRYKDQPYRFLINGQTGEVQGHAPISKARVALAVAIALGAAASVAIVLGVLKG